METRITQMANGSVISAQNNAIKFLTNQVTNRFYINKKFNYINENIDCCLNNNKNSHFIHATNLLFHIVFNKKVHLRTIENDLIREGLDRGVYYRKLDKFTYALGFIYEINETDYKGDTPNVIPVVYNNLFIVGLNCSKFMDEFTNKFANTAMILRDRIDAIEKKLSAKDREKEIKNDEFSTIEIGRNTVKCKSFDDIIMSNEDKDIIRAKVKNFIVNKESYTKHNIKYKLGIIFYGEPGTGKTTMIHSLCSFIKDTILEEENAILDGIIECNGIKSSRDDDDKEEQYTAISDRRSSNNINHYNIKIIEEFDTYFEDSATDYTKDGSFKYNRGATKKDVVNFIDNCTDGTIIIASTNHLNRIKEFDSALVRPGRFDIFMEMKPFDKEDALKFAKWFNLEDTAWMDELQYPIMPSELEIMIHSKLYETISQDLYNTKIDLTENNSKDLVDNTEDKTEEVAKTE